jgi:hypothetical protein
MRPLREPIPAEVRTRPSRPAISAARVTGITFSLNPIAAISVSGLYGG